MNIVLNTRMWDYGQYVDSMEIKNAKSAKLKIKGHFKDLSGRVTSSGILKTEKKGRSIFVTFDSFLYRYDWVISGTVDERKVTIGKDDITEVTVEGLSEFEPVEKNGTRYRLYTPEGSGLKRPLILYLHGMDASGEDNILQMTDTFGAIELAKRFPEMYVMAPQAPIGDPNLSIQEHFEAIKKRGNPHQVDIGMTPFSLKGERGWNRDYLGKVIDIIREMIKAGKVDEKRVYVTGLSMGGGGTLQAVSIAPDLFAAAAPICPSMNGESYAQLLHWPKVPIWVTSAFIDHYHGRHAYILNCFNKLWSEGKSPNEYKYSLYLPEELAKYGIGNTEGLSSKEYYAELHSSWILTYHNELGVIDWMIHHIKGE